MQGNSIREKIKAILVDMRENSEIPVVLVENVSQKTQELFNVGVDKSPDVIVNIIGEMTQEQMAVAVAKDISGELPLKKLDSIKLNKLMYESIRKMIYQLATKYSVTCQDDVEDLAQDCMCRILSQLWRFDPGKAKFTTWSWWVCTSVLNRKYRTTQKHSHILLSSDYENEDGTNSLENVPENKEEGYSHGNKRDIVASEIVETIRSLIYQHPEYKSLILALFGNPNSDDYVMPCSISVTESAKSAGMAYPKARTFYNKFVRPVFLERFRT